MHRNTFVNSPSILHPTLQCQTRPDLFFAGQITGTEGYVGSTMGGLLAGINVARYLHGQPMLELPHTTMIGALLHYVTHAEPDNFQPMKANMGLLPAMDEQIRGKANRYAAYADRAQRDFTAYLHAADFAPLSAQVRLHVA
jgi:methylenetetrahydrofolate--tRNA-(uracil-5-)-methyltransferase